MKVINTIELVCCDCGTNFRIDETLYELRLKDGRKFYCPNGHGQYFSKSLESQLKAASEELRVTKKDLAEAQVEMRRLKCELLAQSQVPKQRRRWLGLFLNRKPDSRNTQHATR